MPATRAGKSWPGRRGTHRTKTSVAWRTWSQCGVAGGPEGVWQCAFPWGEPRTPNEEGSAHVHAEPEEREIRRFGRPALQEGLERHAARAFRPGGRGRRRD